MTKIDDGCPVCSGIIYNGNCSICGERKFYPAKNISLFCYDKVSRDVIHSIKFEGMKHAYKVFVPYMCDRINDFNGKIDIITSVPMNREKLIKRGYNQSKLFARSLSEAKGVEFYELLHEKRNKIRQRDLNYSERFVNVIDRYETVNNTKLKNKVILLIDDVFTTGATINECSRKLINSGANKVYSITVVRADLKKLENV